MMLNRRITIFFIFLIIVVLSQSQKNVDISQENLIKQKISWLTTQLKSRLTLKDQSFKFLETWAKRKGLYQSSVHINVLDKKNRILADKLRNGPIPDINMFVTNFVLYSQLQCQQLGTVQINDHDFSFALEALSQFRDKNSPHGVPQYIFWPQQLINGTWSARPVNLQNLADIWPQNLPKPVQKFLQISGLWMILYIKQMVQAFIIPADNDDSSVNLALEGFLKETNSSHYKYWNSLNYNKLGYYKNLLKYAYRPFESNYQQNKNADEIDTRTYYAIHQFVEMVAEKAKAQKRIPSLILPTTWLMKQDEHIKDLVGIPGNINNVDATVCANVLFGLAYQIILKDISLQDLPELEQVIKDVTDFLVFTIKQKIETRPDIILVYYPSKYDFYWFLARTVHLLKRYSSELNGPLQYAYDNLVPLMKNQATKQIIKNKKIDKSKKSSESKAFWVEFLGNYADKERNEDAVFNTAMAMNALYDTWTIRNKSNLIFDNDTPIQVKQALNQGTNFLLQKIGPKMKQLNSFFSGSMKSLSNSPYSYPANVHQNKGKNVDPQKDSADKIEIGMKYFVKGAIPKQQYQYYESLDWFGYPIPDVFGGYNQIPFPFWSSKAITETMVLNVLSKRLKAKQI